MSIFFFNVIMVSILYVHAKRTGWKIRPRPKAVILKIKFKFKFKFSLKTQLTNETLLKEPHKFHIILLIFVYLHYV